MITSAERRTLSCDALFLAEDSGALGAPGRRRLLATAGDRGGEPALTTAVITSHGDDGRLLSRT
jgi:hypothetical protein